MIPKYIWSYWDNPDIPLHVQLCIDTWKRHCDSEYKIIILNKQSVYKWLKEGIDFPKNIWNLTPDKHSDMFSIALLKKYGGIWFDATILMTASINWILNYENWFAYNHNIGAEIFIMASERDGVVATTIFNEWFHIFSLTDNVRENELCNIYKITDTYIYPQQIVDYITINNAEFRQCILKNSKSVWDTVYKLTIILMKQHGCKSKCDLISTLNLIEDDMPEEIMSEPLHKLQGANTQNVKDMILNEKSWWNLLVNNNN